MKKTILFILISILFSTTVFSQETDISNKTKTNKEHNWYFFPVQMSIYPGVWIPTGKLSKYYYPCFKIGTSLGLMISKKMRIEYAIAPRFLKNKEEIEFITEDSILSSDTPMIGSIGGTVLYGLHKNKNVF